MSAEVIANGLPLWNGAQVAVNTTLVAPLTFSVAVVFFFLVLRAPSAATLHEQLPVAHRAKEWSRLIQELKKFDS